MSNVFLHSANRADILGTPDIRPSIVVGLVSSRQADVDHSQER